MKTTLIILIVVLLALMTTAASCEPDPDPTSGVDNRPSWQQGIEATETYGAGQWHAQLTEMAQPEP